MSDRVRIIEGDFKGSEADVLEVLSNEVYAGYRPVKVPYAYSLMLESGWILYVSASWVIPLEVSWKDALRKRLSNA